MSNDRLSDSEIEEVMNDDSLQLRRKVAEQAKLANQSPAAQGAVADDVLWTVGMETAEKIANDYANRGGNVYARNSGRAVARAIRDAINEKEHFGDPDKSTGIYAHPAPAGERPAEQWGTGWICGNNYRERGAVCKTVGKPDGEPWYETQEGVRWSAYDVRFKPDEPAAPAAPNATPRTKICISPLATRALLYSDTLGGEQVCSDDMWAVTTDELNALTRELAAVVAPAKVGMVAEETCDSVRGVLQCIRNNPGVLMQNVHQHCDMRGDDMRLWPTWALAYEGYVTEASAARLIYDIMRAHIAQGKVE